MPPAIALSHRASQCSSLPHSRQPDLSDLTSLSWPLPRFVLRHVTSRQTLSNFVCHTSSYFVASHIITLRQTSSYFVTSHIVTHLHTGEYAGRSFLGFDRLTHIPIQKKLIEQTLLSPSEIAWLNSYHQQVSRLPLVPCQSTVLVFTLVFFPFYMSSYIVFPFAYLLLSSCSLTLMGYFQVWDRVGPLLKTPLAREWLRNSTAPL